MTKQIKLIKFMIVVLLIIPIALFFTGIIQTFVLKSKQDKLTNATQELYASQQELEKQKEIEEYVYSDEYKEEYYKHNNPGFGTNSEDKYIKLK